MRRRRPRAAVLGVLLTGALLAGCGGGASEETEGAPVLPPAPIDVPHEPSETPSPRPGREFTVGTTDVITQLDPAAVSTVGSQAVSESVFQTLMTTAPNETILKPDAARDCIFEQPTVYTCTLQEGLQFHSGKPLRSADVKFSIERALALDVPGSSASLMRSIDRIQTPDGLTVRFVLEYPDTDIGFALASPAASIVDRSAYQKDELLASDQTPVGSGAYRLNGSQDGVWSFTRYESYLGYAPGRINRISLAQYANSDTLEQAMANQDVDVAWRGLDEAAVTRQRNSAAARGGRSAEGFAPTQMNGSRIIRLAWDADSEVADDQTTRVYASEAIASRRTLSSLLPLGIKGAEAGLYAAGGLPDLVAPENTPVHVTVGYDPRMPDGEDIAHALVRDLDATEAVEANVVAHVPGSSTGKADLHVVDERSATRTARAWLDAYLTSPPARERTEVETVVTAGLSSTDPETSAAATRTLQFYAAEDAWVLPLSQSDERVFVREGYGVDLARMGPGWQLNLAAFSEAE